MSALPPGPDMLKDTGQSSKANTILLPHSPGHVGDISSQLRDAIITGNEAASRR